MPTAAPVRHASGGAVSHNSNAIAGVSQALTSVPAGSLLYAWLWLDVNTGDTAGTPAMTDNVGLTWTLVAERSKHSDGGSAQNGHVSVWRALYTAGGSITVSGSGSGGTITTSSPVSLNVEVITGGRIQYGVAEIVNEASSTGTVKCPSGGTAPVGRYSYIRGSNCDWNSAATPTAATGWTARVTSQPTPQNYTLWGADMVSQAAERAVQLLSTAPTSGTVNNSIMVEHLPVFTPLANGGEDGSNTVAPVAATTGTADQPWDTVTTSGGGAITYSTDQAAHGTLSYKIASTGASTAFTMWTVSSIGRLDRIYGRFYVYAATNNAGLIFLRLRGAATQVLKIGMDASGHLEVRNSANTVIQTFTTAITNSNWCRVEFDVTPSVAAGAVTVKLFNTTDSTTVTETHSLTSQALGTTFVDEVAWGQTTSATSMPTYYLDDVQVNATALPGPVGGGTPDQGVTLTGLATAAAVGQPAITTTTSVTLTGVATASAVGQPAVAPGAVTIELESAPTLSAVGEPLIAGDDVGVTLTGVSSAAGVGQPAIVPGAVGVTLTGTASTAAVGTPAVAPGAVTINATGVASASGVGQPAVGVGATTVALTGVASAAVVGQPAIAPGATGVTLTGVASAATAGTPAIAPGDVGITLTGVASTAGVGQPAVTVGLTIAPIGVPSGSAVGQPALTPGAATVVLTGVPSAAGVGQPAVAAPAVPTVVLTGVVSGSGVGQPLIAPGPTTVVLAGVASAAAVGVPAVSGGIPAILLTGVASQSAFGLLTVVRETVDYGLRAAPHVVTMTVPSATSSVT